MPFPSPGTLPDPGIEPGSSALQVASLESEPLGKPEMTQLLKDRVGFLNLGFPFPNPTVQFHMLPLGREIADEFSSGLDNQSDSIEFEKKSCLGGITS